jgi:phosphomannomutase
MPIHFGTDGWRAVISDTFTFDNLRLVVQAVADAVASEGWSNGIRLEKKPDPRKVVIGFDTRFLSDRYAREAARVMAANGFNVYLCQADSSTPAVAYSTYAMHAIAGIMITASHNAPRYNGIKVKSPAGSSASMEQCRRVEVYLNDNESQGRGPNLIDYDLARQKKLITRFNPLPEYQSHLRKLIDFDVIAENPQYLVVDSMFGSGRGIIKGMLDGTGCEVFEIRNEMNPGFGGVHPEPIACYLHALSGALSTGKGNLGLATDGDADRIGAMDERGNFVDPHKIMALALRYLVEKKKLTGSVVRTVSTTRMIDRLAAKYGLVIHETPVGFNHIAEHMLHEDVLIGGEESGGISFKGHIPMGDGVLMGLLIVEMVADAGVTLGELVKDLLKDVGPAFYERKDMRLHKPVVKDMVVEKLKNEAPAKLGGEEVVDVRTLDGVKYILADDSWLLIRPSGTEPTLRVYAEGRSEEMVKALISFGEKIAASVT